jgi:hypothetical protein
MTLTTTEVYEAARVGVSQFMLSRNNHVWEDYFHDAYARWLEAGAKSLGTERGISNYFIRASLNLQLQQADRNVQENNAARTRYLNAPMVSPRYQLDGDVVIAIRNLHAKGYTTTQLAEASGLRRGRIQGIVAGRTYSDVI